jgi:hypothetical protein
MSMFRIGGVYRQRNGEVVRLAPYSGSYGSSFVDGYGSAIAIKDGTPRGSRHLSSGRMCAFFAHDDAKFTGDLLPGELTFVNGEWVSMTPTLDKMEAEKAAEMNQCDGCMQGADLRGGLHVDRYGKAFMGCERHKYAEPTRPALDWNKPASTDRFPGFTVTSQTQDQQASPTHAVQRCADFDGLVMKAR